MAIGPLREWRTPMRIDSREAPSAAGEEQPLVVRSQGVILPGVHAVDGEIVVHHVHPRWPVKVLRGRFNWLIMHFSDLYYLVDIG